MKIVRFLILTAALLSVMLLPAAAWEQCPVHAFDYHSFPDELSDIIDQFIWERMIIKSNVPCMLLIIIRSQMN